MMEFSQFRHKSPNFEKLKSFGFSERGGDYFYNAEILDGQFTLTVKISRGGEVVTSLCDEAGEPYALHLVEGAAGSFVGEVRAAFYGVLERIAEGCFERDVFKGELAHAVIDFVRTRYGGELEYLWDKFPDNAVWRRKDNSKWFGVMLTVSRRKLGFDDDCPAHIIDLRMPTEEIEAVVDGKKYFAGYHMNKKHWVTICLDGSVPFEEICARIDESYALAAKK